MADAGYGSLPFAEQIAFFRRKANVNTDAWTDLWQAEHDHAFMVAGANRDDLVADLRAAVDRAIADGATLADFRKDFDAIVAKYGWSYNGGRNWRSRVIYETNLRTSYAAGRYAQLQEAKRFRPYWQYVHSDAVMHPRPLHLAWNGLVLHADDPWWNTHFPPGGWGCQCTVHALNDRDLARLGKSGPDTAPPLDMQTVTVGVRGPTPRTVETPAGIDPGFGYIPGADAFAREAQVRLAAAARLPAAPAAAGLAEFLRLPRITRAIEAAYVEWLDAVLADPMPRGRALLIGALDEPLLSRMRASGAAPGTAVIGVADSAALAGAQPDDWRPLLAALNDPRAVLLDSDRGRILFAADLGPPTGKIVAEVEYGDDGEPTFVRIVRRVDDAQWRALSALTLLRGGL